MNTWKSKLYDWLFCLLFISIPFEKFLRVVPNIILALLSIIFLSSIKGHFNSLKRRKISLRYSIVILMGFTLYTGIHFAIFQFGDKEFKQIALATVILILSWKISRIKLVINAFIVSIFILSIISLITIIKYYLSANNFDFGNGEIIQQILILDRPYLGIVTVIAAILALFSKNLGIKTKLLTVSFFLGFLLLISARFAIVSLLFTIVLFAFLKLKIKEKISLSISIIAILSLGFLFNGNLRDRFFFTDRNENFLKSVSVWEPRAVIWPCSIKVISAEGFNHAFGNGYEASKSQLLDCYRQDILNNDKRKWFLESKFNSHNQYLSLYMTFGTFGLLLYFVFTVKCWKELGINMLGKNILIVFSCFMLIENVFARQIGGYIFGLVLLIIYKYGDERN